MQSWMNSCQTETNEKAYTKMYDKRDHSEIILVKLASSHSGIYTSKVPHGTKALHQHTINHTNECLHVKKWEALTIGSAEKMGGKCQYELNKIGVKA